MSTKYDITIDQGADFTLLIKVQQKIPDGCTTNCSTIDMNLTGKGVRGQIRKTYDSCEAFAFTATIVTALEGEFKLYLPARTSETMPAGSYVWDCEVYDLTDLDNVLRPFYGVATVLANVTKV